jgi:hypothetical protein
VDASYSACKHFTGSTSCGWSDKVSVTCKNTSYTVDDTNDPSSKIFNATHPTAKVPLGPCSYNATFAVERDRPLCGDDLGLFSSTACGPSPGPAPPPPAPSGGCQTFAAGLCPGDADCMCTTGATCGAGRTALLPDPQKPLSFTAQALAAAGQPVGACAGQCLRVVHGACSGPNSCMKSAGPC